MSNFEKTSPPYRNLSSDNVDSEVRFNYEHSSLWSFIYDVKLIGSLAYCAMAQGLMILDVSDPTNPSKISETYIPENISTDVEISGDYAFVCHSTGIGIINVTNSAAATIVGEIRDIGSVQSSAISGNYLYVANYNSLLVYDIVNPESPRRVAEIDSVNAVQIVVSGNLAYITDLQGYLNIVDITTKDLPLLMGRYNYSGGASDFDVYGNFVYLASGSQGIRVIDVTNKQNPDEVNRIAGAGSVASLLCAEGYLYACSDSGLCTLNLSDPVSPSVVGKNKSWGALYGSMAYSSGLLFNGYGYFLVFDLSLPESPTSIGYLWVSYSPSAIDYDMTYLLVSGWHGTFLMNKQTLEPITSLSSFQRGTDLTAVNSTGYLTDGDGLLVFDIDVDSLRVRGRLSMTTRVAAIEVAGSYAFLAGDSGLFVVDVSLKDSPTRVGYFATPSSAYDIVIAGDLAYLATSTSVLILNVSQPQNPVLVKSIPFDQDEIVSNIAIRGKYLYVTGFIFGLVIYDVSNPQTPVPVGSIGFVGSRDLILSGPYAYISSANIGIRVVNVSSPSLPYLAGSYDTPNYAYRATIDDLNHTLYVADGGSAISLKMSYSPVVAEISHQNVVEGSSFNPISLDNFVFDTDDSIQTLSWSLVSSEVNGFHGTIDSGTRIANIEGPQTNKSHGSDSALFVFRATDQQGLVGDDTALFVVTWINNAPVISPVPDQNITEDSSFVPVPLDDYITDDDPDSTIVWGDTPIQLGGAGFSMQLDVMQRLALLQFSQDKMRGVDTAIYVLSGTDPGGLSTDDTVVFVVNWFDDPPAISGIRDTSIQEGETFPELTLDDYVYDPDSFDRNLRWKLAPINSTLLDAEIDSVSRVAHISHPGGEFSGSGTFQFIVSDSAGLADTVEVVFTVTSVNDAPTISQMPQKTFTDSDTIFVINLVDFVDDPDNDVSELLWSPSALENNYSVTINPGNQAIIRKLESASARSDVIRLKAIDPGGLSDSVFFVVRSHLSSVELSGALPSKQYKMISLPVVPDNFNSASILDELNGRYKYDWRLLHFNPTLGQYEENPSTLVPGLGYWIISSNPIAAIELPGTSIAPDTVLDGHSYYRSTIYSGWNQIGSPLTYTTSFFACKVWAGNTVYDISDSESPVLPGLYHYTGKGNEVKYDSLGESQALLERGEGYWIYVEDGCTECQLWFSMKENQPSESPTPNVSVSHAGDWSLRIQAECGGYEDNDNHFGVRQVLATDVQISNFPEPPHMAPFVSVSFPGNFSTDFRSSVPEDSTWQFLVSNDLKAKVFLRFGSDTDSSSLPKFILKDITLEESVLLNANSSYSYDSPGGERAFTIRVVGKNVAVSLNDNSIPTSFKLYPNYPNPFNSSTKLSFDLTERSWIRLSIRNLLGQTVRNLAHGEFTKGTQYIVWDGTDDLGHSVPSGVYFYTIETGENSETRKMLLLK